MVALNNLLPIYASMLNSMVAPAVAGAGANPLSTLTSSNVATAQAYANAVDQNGNVNQDKLRDGGGDRAGIVVGYAAEFAVGKRTDAKNMPGAIGALDAMGPDAKTFALVASRYKNAGGNYNNGRLKDLLEKAGRQDLITGGVGNKDVQTLGAVAKAIDDGSLSLQDVFKSTGEDSVEDDDKYERAIAAVQAGDLNSNIENANGPRASKPSNAGNAGDASGAKAAGSTAPAAASAKAPATAGASGGNSDIISLILPLLAAILQLMTGVLGGGSNSAANSNAFTGSLGGAGAPAAAAANPGGTAALVKQPAAASKGNAGSG